MNNTFIGRKNETELIRRYYDSPKSEMIAVYGRRRVGKTFLIKETMGEFFDFEFVGMYKTPAKIQRELFQKKLNSLSGDDKTAPKDWYLLLIMSLRWKIFFVDTQFDSSPNHSNY